MFVLIICSYNIQLWTSIHTVMFFEDRNVLRIRDGVTYIFLGIKEISQHMVRADTIICLYTYLILP